MALPDARGTGGHTLRPGMTRFVVNR
jgi:hypothetical protein